MKKKTLIATVVSAALVVLPADDAQADRGTAVVAGAIVAIGAAALLSQRRNNKRAQASRATSVQPTASQSAAAPRRLAPVCDAFCQQNKQTQAALNHFGYDAGGVDGKVGPRTRGAMQAYESAMGFDADGNLDSEERAFLMSAYYRSKNGEYGVHYQAYAVGGAQGYLNALNDERMGYAPSSTTPPPRNTQVDQSGNAALDSNVDGDPWTAFDVTPTSRSMTAYCIETNQLTIANGGYIQTATPANASLALSEQFCLAREYSENKGQKMLASVSGMTTADVKARCEQFRDELSSVFASLESQSREQIIRQTQDKATRLGRQGMVNAGQICLGIGYTEDDTKMALAGALLLTAGGEVSYGEVVGHHLREGFGVAPHANRAGEWHLETIAAMDAGATAAILPSQAAQRNSVIRSAYG